MAHKKPPSAYVVEIETLHSTIKGMPDGKAKDKIKEELHRKLGKWEQDKISKIVYVANNEKTPWPLFKNVGLFTQPMKTKKETGYDQVGDYICYVFVDDGRENKQLGYNKCLPIVVERKTVADFYSSIVPKDNWVRFKREIQRFKDDDRFNQMIIIVEGSLQEFLRYKPEIIHTKTGKKTFNRGHPVSPNVKRAKIAKCFVLGVPVLFAGTTHQAMNVYSDLIRQTIIENYVDLLELE